MNGKRITGKQRKMNPKSLLNLRPFKPGASGNPSGLAKGALKISDAYIRLLKMDYEAFMAFKPMSVADAIAYRQVGAAIFGLDALPAAKEIADRSEGRAKQHIEHTASGEVDALVDRIRNRIMEATGREISREEAIERIGAYKPDVVSNLIN